MKKLNSLITHKSSKGFTLIELMVVITIIAILALAGIVIYTNVQKGARDSRRKADIDAVTKALEVHYLQDSGEYLPVQASWFSSGAVPKDPKNATGNYIEALNAPITGLVRFETFKVCADLEGTAGADGTSWSGTQQDYCRSNVQ